MILFLDILNDNIENILEDKFSYIPVNLCTHTYLILPLKYYDIIKNKYQWVYISVVYLLLTDKLEDIKFLKNFLVRLSRTRDNYNLIISYLNKRDSYMNDFNIKILDPTKDAYNLYKQYKNINNILSKKFKGFKYNISSHYNIIFNNDDFDLLNPDSYNVSSVVNNNLQALQILINDTKINYLHNIVTILTNICPRDMKIDITNTHDSISLSVESNYLKYSTLENNTLPYFTLDNNYFLIYKRAIKVIYITF